MNEPRSRQSGKDQARPTEHTSKKETGEVGRSIRRKPGEATGTFSFMRLLGLLLTTWCAVHGVLAQNSTNNEEADEPMGRKGLPIVGTIDEFVIHVGDGRYITSKAGFPANETITEATAPEHAGRFDFEHDYIMVTTGGGGRLFVAEKEGDEDKCRRLEISETGHAGWEHWVVREGQVGPKILLKETVHVEEERGNATASAGDANATSTFFECDDGQGSRAVFFSALGDCSEEPNCSPIELDLQPIVSNATLTYHSTNLQLPVIAGESANTTIGVHVTTITPPPMEVTCPIVAMAPGAATSAAASATAGAGAAATSSAGATAGADTGSWAGAGSNTAAGANTGAGANTAGANTAGANTGAEAGYGSGSIAGVAANGTNGNLAQFTGAAAHAGIETAALAAIALFFF